ncbi:MAG: hypothetical protein DCC49_08825 [Acidobacteria bacterium]|nr:MAG: hypothetical protein DCC49_08825 [Acidobacteriota bacterium]
MTVESTQPRNAYEKEVAKKLDYDEVYWGSHCVDCYPGSCPYHVYVKDGKIIREEIAGTFPQIEEGVPDMNPLGCNKGAAWSQQIEGPDRPLHPLRRVGERGSGKWEEISWDEALGDIADAIIDAMEEVGPESIVREGTPEIGAGGGTDRLINLLGGIVLDLNGSINDFSAGHHLTFGKFYPSPSIDDGWHGKLSILWHTNPAHTCIPFFHFLASKRYNGGEVVLIAPDVSPSHSHVDYHIPVQFGSDPALALSMCQVIVEEGLVDKEFVGEQTDLSLLVRLDNERYLRQSDLEEGGHDEQFYHWHPEKGIVEASRSNIKLDFQPVLEGSTTATLADGTEVEVRPLMVRMVEMLNADYRPEDTQEITGVNPETVRTIARKVGTSKTNILMGMGGNKAYHSDLYQRTMNLLLGLTGNWGKKGTGINCWAAGLLDGMATAMAKKQRGVEGAETVLQAFDMVRGALKAQDPSLSTDELTTIEMWRKLGSLGGSVPIFFWWYWHCGYKERWDNPEWNDPDMKRSFTQYFDEAMEAGWWDGLDRPGPETPPRVFIECGGNTLRRTRGGKGTLLEHLWPKLKMIVTIDWRMSQTALHSDIVLPAAQHYEKVGFHIPNPFMMLLTLSDKAAPPRGEAKEEWEIYSLLCKKLEERAAARGLETYDIKTRGRGAMIAAAVQGRDASEMTPSESVETRKWSDLYNEFTLGGELTNTEIIADEAIRDTAYSGPLADGTTLETVRESGWVRFQDWGFMAMDKGQATPFPKHETHAPFRHHVEDGHPYPTLARRAQFLIEHPWYVEAGEDIPVHKDPPPMGGQYPFKMTTGHNRWSVHAMNMCNPVLIQTHRGQPFILINDKDAERLGLEDGQPARISNDAGEFTVPIRTSGTQIPYGLTIYNGWDPFMFKGWQGPNEVEPGMVKWLQMAGGYGHLQYAMMEWQPVPSDRAVFVNVEPA